MLATFYVYGLKKRKGKPATCTCGMPGVDSDKCPLKGKMRISTQPKYLGYVKAAAERKALRKARKLWPEFQLDVIYKESIKDKRSMAMIGPKFKKQKSKQKEK